MKKTFFFLFVALTSMGLRAQTEKFDIATYPTLKDWTRTTKDGVMIFSQSDSKTGGFCIIALYAATPSAGSADKDFQSEWKDLAIKPFNAQANPTTETQTTTDGWQAVAGASPALQDGINSYIILTVYSGFGKKTSVMANLNDQAYVPILENFLDKLRLDKLAKIGGINTNKPSLTTNVNNQLFGNWAKSASSPPQYNNGVLVNLANNGYYKGQYNFKPDGKYIFHGESMLSYNDYSLVDESGTYSVTGTQLIVTPVSGKIRKVDSRGALKKSESLPLTQRNYSWQLHHFEGINETNLVLSAVSENIVDGGHGGNSLFPNSFLYSRKYQPEWKFKP